MIEQLRTDAAVRAPPLGGFFGDPQRPIGSRYFGNLVSGLDPGVRRLSGPLAPAVPQSTPRDRRVSIRRLRVVKTQSLRKLRATIALNEAGGRRPRRRCACLRRTGRPRRRSGCDQRVCALLRSAP